MEAKCKTATVMGVNVIPKWAIARTMDSKRFIKVKCFCLPTNQPVLFELEIKLNYEMERKIWLFSRYK